LFQSHCHDPAEYAWRWIDSDPAFESASAAGAELGRWLRHFRNQGVAAVSSGFMILQRCEPGAEWTRCDSRATAELAPNAYLEILRKGETPRAMIRELRGMPHFASIASLDTEIANLTRELLRFALISVAAGQAPDQVAGNSGEGGI
jgi:hypothetical protein